MKKTTLLFLMLFVLGFISHGTAQERQIIQGYCKDENGKAIENVSVYAHDSLLVSVTDEQGRFTYGYAKAGEKLRFAHMVFEPTYYTIKDKDINGKNLTVKMKTKSHELLEVEITANAPHTVFDNPVMTVLDYTLREDGIYMIVYRRRHSALLHLSFDGDTLHEMPISSRYKYLTKDAFSDIYAINDYQASQVGFIEYGNGKKGQMNFYHSMPIIAIVWAVKKNPNCSITLWMKKPVMTFGYCYILEESVLTFGLPTLSITRFTPSTTNSISLPTPTTRPLSSMPSAMNWSAIPSPSTNTANGTARWNSTAAGNMMQQERNSTPFSLTTVSTP